MKNLYLSGLVLLMTGYVLSMFAPPIERIEIGKIRREVQVPPVVYASVPPPVKKTMPVKKTRPTAEPLNLDGNRLAYIKKWAPTAQALHKKYGIPASITLAQGILESQSGGSYLVKKTNNHFGIKCFGRTCSKGHCFNYADDTHRDRFKVYQNGMESFVHHAQFLHKPRYKHLHGRDWMGWAKGLGPAGYATSKTYGGSLIKLIKEYRLYEYDN